MSTVPALLVLALAAVADGATLFFSQFQEASSGNNKYFQIYNPTSASIDLSAGYSFGRCSNGCAADGVFEYCSTFASGATIAAGGTYLICNSGLEGDTSACDEVLSDYLVYFNGDDFISLITGTDCTTATSADIVDQMGLFSTTDPGSNWPVCGTSSGMDTQNGLLTRATDVCCGDTTGAAFEDSFSGTCEWTETDQVTTPATWTTTTDCSSVSCSSSTTPAPTTPAPTVSSAPTPVPIPAPTAALSTIYSIQYVSDVSDDCGDSPKDGEVVRVECTVSAVESSGFYW